MTSLKFADTLSLTTHTEILLGRPNNYVSFCTHVQFLGQ